MLGMCKLNNEEMKRRDNNWKYEQNMRKETLQCRPLKQQTMSFLLPIMEYLLINKATIVDRIYVKTL